MPPEEPRPGTRRAAEAIEAYLAQHPAAADSEQGIAQWWLPAMGMEVPMEVVCEALDWLAEHPPKVAADALYYRERLEVIRQRHGAA